MSVLSKILEHKIIAIIRGAQPTDVYRIAEALYEGGIRIMEITMNSDEPLAVIEKLSAEFGGRMVIGAGTVLDAGMAEAAVDAGAMFVLSPIVSTEVIRTAKERGVVAIPGAYTPTEIYQAYQQGGDLIKVFPASSPSYIKELRGPLPHIPLLPTGGITSENIREFRQAGAAGFGIGSSLVNARKEVNDLYLEDITTAARKLVHAITE